MNDSLKKISVRIYRPILARLEEKLEAGCLRRDDFLNRVLEAELPHLDEECAENSPEAQQFIADRLDKLARKQVSLALRSDLVERLNEICARKRIVRDAFFNRLFFLLAAPTREMSLLFFGSDDNQWLIDVYEKDWNSSPRFGYVFDPIVPVEDPFFLLRSGLEDEVEYLEIVEKLPRGTPRGIYSKFWINTLNKESHLYGLNCYLPDDQIPDHPEEQGTEDLLALLSK